MGEMTPSERIWATNFYLDMFDNTGKALFCYAALTLYGDGMKTTSTAAIRLDNRIKNYMPKPTALYTTSE